MSNLIRGPWGIKSETITLDGIGSNYKTMNYFLAAEKQEYSYNNRVYLAIYIINNDYNRVFLLSNTKEVTEKQISFRKLHPDYINQIKRSL